MKTLFLFVLFLVLPEAFAYADRGIWCIATDSKGTYEIRQKIGDSDTYEKSFVDRGKAAVNFKVKISKSLNTIFAVVRDEKVDVEATGAGWIDVCPKSAGASVRLKTQNGDFFFSCSIVSSDQ